MVYSFLLKKYLTIWGNDNRLMYVKYFMFHICHCAMMFGRQNAESLVIASSISYQKMAH